MKKIKIIGSYITKFGELWNKSLEDLFEDAIAGAVCSVEGVKGKIDINDSGSSNKIEYARFDSNKIDAVFVANMAAGQLNSQLHLNALVSQMLPHNPPAFRTETACASGGTALVLAELALYSGKYKTVLVVGAEKMTDISANETTKILSGASDYQNEYGSTFPALYALLAQEHMNKFGTTRTQLSQVASKNHMHALTNPNAQFRKKISISDVNNSNYVATPLRLLDCSPISDGASAVILTTKKSKKYEDKTIMESFGQAQDSLSLVQRKSLTELVATKQAVQVAYESAKISAKDISLAEVHDCFTIAEILAIEDLGFFKKGSGGIATENKKTTYGGSIIVNPSGGLKACGHPVGATGIKQVAFLSQYLQHDIYSSDFKNHQKSQSKTVKQSNKIYALAHNVGGSGATAVVHILSNKKRVAT
jgi:acetyl-CoA C-acetyltransferase